MGKRHKPEEIIAKLRQVDVMTAQGTTVADAVRAIGVTEVTDYRWRQEYGGLKSDQIKRMKELELLKDVLADTNATFVLGQGDLTDQLRTLIAQKSVTKS